MLIYDSLSGGKKELLKTKKRINLFVCGPTVYDYSHIGHARTYIFFDIFVRYLRSLGIKVFYLQNITDIDDRIIARAKESKVSTEQISRQFTKEYLEDMKALSIKSVNKYAPATKFIRQIVEQVQSLIDKGYAYRTEDGYYFDISRFKNYGKLSRRTSEQAENSVSRIDDSVTKKNKGDFCLWKFHRSGSASAKTTADKDPHWDTPLGKGRPGWHIEDTAISEKFFGPQYDIHGGGLDLKFPHHEAEIAQQESVSGKEPFVKLWMHTGFLLINGEKMSKSLNNFVTIRDFLKEYDATTLRWMVLTHHYRSPVNYTKEMARQSKAAIKNIKEFIMKLDFVYRNNRKTDGNISIELKTLDQKVKEALNDDFNTPLAIARIFEFINEKNPKIWGLGRIEAKYMRQYMDKLMNVLGLAIKADKIPKDVTKLSAEREILRRNKQFIRGDALRKKSLELGYIIEDTPFGPFIIIR